MSTLAGKAWVLFSDTRAAAVTWAIMKPELTPLSAIRKGGRPLILGSTRTARRRSAIEPISHRAIASMSAAKATGWAWKLPPESASSPNSSGLSLTALASISSVLRGIADQVERRAHHLRLAAEAVGILHLVAFGVRIPDLAVVEQPPEDAATAIWPGWPRAS